MISQSFVNQIAAKPAVTHTKTRNTSMVYFLLKMVERMDAMNAPIEPFDGLVTEGIDGTSDGSRGDAGMTAGCFDRAGKPTPAAFHLASHCLRWSKPTVPPFNRLVTFNI